MNIEKLFEMVISNPTNISISYSNINGEEKLIVNGEDLTIDNYIEKYKKNLEKLDDCDFLQIVEKLHGMLDVQLMDKLIDQKSHTEEESEILKSMIDVVYQVMREHISNKIEKLQEILENL